MLNQYGVTFTLPVADFLDNFGTHSLIEKTQLVQWVRQSIEFH